VAPGLKVLAACKRRGLIMRANEDWIALGPPLITTEPDIDRIFEILDASLEEVEAELLPEGLSKEIGGNSCHSERVDPGPLVTA
jgi:hypothetical protein